MAIKKQADEQAVRELELYIDNDFRIYTRKLEFEKSAARKICSGKYDKAKAPKLFRYLADEAAKAYSREFGDGGTIFSTADRDAVARQLATDFDSRVSGWRSGRFPDDVSADVQQILSSAGCKR